MKIMDWNWWEHKLLGKEQMAIVTLPLSLFNECIEIFLKAVAIKTKTCMTPVARRAGQQCITVGWLGSPQSDLQSHPTAIGAA